MHWLPDFMQLEHGSFLSHRTFLFLQIMQDLKCVIEVGEDPLTGGGCVSSCGEFVEALLSAPPRVAWDVAEDLRAGGGDVFSRGEFAESLLLPATQRVAWDRVEAGLSPISSSIRCILAQISERIYSKVCRLVSWDSKQLMMHARTPKTSWERRINKQCLSKFLSRFESFFDEQAPLVPCRLQAFPTYSTYFYVLDR